MVNYALPANPQKSVMVYGRALRISRKSSVTVCRAITGKPLDKGKALLGRLALQKESLQGRYYTNVVKELSGLLDSAAKNAEFKGLDPNKLVIHASAHKGFTFYRPRSWKRRREQRKIANIQIVLTER